MYRTKEILVDREEEKLGNQYIESVMKNVEVNVNYKIFDPWYMLFKGFLRKKSPPSYDPYINFRPPIYLNLGTSFLLVKCAAAQFQGRARCHSKKFFGRHFRRQCLPPAIRRFRILPSRSMVRFGSFRKTIFCETRRRTRLRKFSRSKIQCGDGTRRFQVVQNGE